MGNIAMAQAAATTPARIPRSFQVPCWSPATSTSPAATGRPVARVMEASPIAMPTGIHGITRRSAKALQARNTDSSIKKENRVVSRNWLQK